jgi:hypothetical protein
MCIYIHILTYTHTHTCIYIYIYIHTCGQLRENVHLKRKYETSEQTIQELESMVDELRATAAGQIETLADVESELKEKDEMLQYVENEVAELKEKFK